MESILKLEQVACSYNRKKLFERVDLNLEHGQLWVMMGQHGSGKSTLLRIAAGLNIPAQGTRQMQSDITIGYAPEQLNPLRRTVYDYLSSLGQMHHLSQEVLQHRIHELAESLNMVEDLEQRMINFSKDKLQKVNIMQAMLHKPQLLLLDEPLSGLNIDSREQVISLFTALKRQGTTFLIASHKIESISHIIDQVLWLEHNTATIKAPATILDHYQPTATQAVLPPSDAVASVETEPDTCLIHCLLSAVADQRKRAESQAALSDAATFRLQHIKGVVQTEQYEQGWIIRVHADQANFILKTLLQTGWTIQAFYPESKQPSI